VKRELATISLLGAVACSSSEPHQSATTSTSAQSASAPSAPGPGGARPGFRPLASMNLSWGDGAPVQVVRLPVPVRRSTGMSIAALHIPFPTLIRISKEEAEKIHNKIEVPCNVVYWDATTGQKVDIEYTGNDDAVAEHFGLRPPADGVVGHFDDPKWLPEKQREELRQRLYAAIDVLLPFFADENRPWTEEANRAARDVRDFFPLAAEPGLWPYYKAEGKDFFAWVEKNAPPAKAPLPWEGPKQ
jgi:hypothetical protein